MAFYLNPKEGHTEWLFNNAMSISEADARVFHNWEEEALLCFIEGIPTIGIVYDDRERLAFSYPDGFEKRWYVCNRKIAENAYGSDMPWAQPYE